eukprot:14441183-Alexandrium_andersonii.AAC.1
MSASLVGSEMCIRDRLQALLGSRWRCWPLCWHGWVAAGPFGRSPSKCLQAPEGARNCQTSA